MSDDQPKKSLSEPPPATDELDKDWGATPTPPPAGVAPAPAKPAPSAAVAPTPARDEDEDDEDEDDDRARSARPVARSAAGASSSDDWLPDWAPWAVLGGLIVIGLVGGLGGIGGARPRAEAASPEPATEPVRTAEARPSQAAARPAMAAAGDSQTVEASHLLVAYQNALRADPKITRTKDEAKARAAEALGKAKKGAAFEKLVAEYSDEPGAAARGGKLGSFTRERMVKPFADAAFALKPGELSGVVETAFGFHVIQRTK